MQCEGKIAIVTGASGEGIGRSTALTLAREGAKVVVNYHTAQDRAAAIVNHITRDGGKAIAVQADIFTAEGCETLVTAARSHYGQVDICIISPGGGWHPEPLEQLDTSAALADLHHEVAPIYYLMPLVLPEMYARGWGRLIGVGLHPTKLPPAYAYNVAKAGRARALFLAQDQAWSHGVTVNLIAPGPVVSIDGLAQAAEQCAHGPAWQNRTDVTPQDIAEGIAFLCSDAGRFVTGCVLPYDFSTS